MAFGDRFLEDIRAYRETRLGEAGKRARFPIWGYDTAPLARRFLDAGFRAVLVCVDSRTLDPCFAGRDYDEQLLAELPAGVDPCGENGEFHTFVTAGPIFARPIVCHRCDIVERDGFVKVEVRAFEADVDSNRLVTPRRRCRTLRPGRGAVRSPRLRTPCRNGGRLRSFLQPDCRDSRHLEPKRLERYSRASADTRDIGRRLATRLIGAMRP